MDLLDYELKYKDSQEIMDLINMVKETEAGDKCEITQLLRGIESELDSIGYDFSRIKRKLK